MDSHDQLQLDVAQVRRLTKHLVIGSDLRYFPAVDSSNRVARELPPGSWRTGTVIVTDYQEAGRGRQDRAWLAPPGSSLLLSLIIEPTAPVPPGETVMIAALAVGDAIEKETGLQTQLKWPNDVLIDGRKVCGILAEQSDQGAVKRLIVGFGINVNFDPSEVAGLPGSATSLRKELGSSVNREGLLAGLFKSLDMWYRYLRRDPDGVFSAWTARLATIGKPVAVTDVSDTWHGFATGVQRDGALLVRDDKGETHVVYAADVTVRQLEGFTSP